MLRSLTTQSSWQVYKRRVYSNVRAPTRANQFDKTLVVRNEHNAAFELFNRFAKCINCFDLESKKLEMMSASFISYIKMIRRLVKNEIIRPENGTFGELRAAARCVRLLLEAKQRKCKS